MCPQAVGFSKTKRLADRIHVIRWYIFAQLCFLRRLLIVRLLTSFGNASKHVHGMGDHEYWGTLQNLLLKFVHFKSASLPFLFWSNDCLLISRLDSVLPYCMSVNILSTDLLPRSFYISTSSPSAGCTMGHWWHQGETLLLLTHGRAPVATGYMSQHKSSKKWECSQTIPSQIPQQQVCSEGLPFLFSNTFYFRYFLLHLSWLSMQCMCEHSDNKCKSLKCLCKSCS